MSNQQELINEYIAVTGAIKQLEIDKGYLEMQLTQSMEYDDATAIPHPTHKVELKRTMAYDPSKLAALRELVDPKELESSGAYIPEHEETITVKEKFNMTKLKPLGKYAGVKQVIEDAAYVASIKLSITEKEA